MSKIRALRGLIKGRNNGVVVTRSYRCRACDVKWHGLPSCWCCGRKRNVVPHIGAAL